MTSPPYEYILSFTPRHGQTARRPVHKSTRAVVLPGTLVCKAKPLEKVLFLFLPPFLLAFWGDFSFGPSLSAELWLVPGTRVPP